MNDEKLKILIVDDEIAMQKLLHIGFMETNFEIINAQSGNEAFKCFKNEKFSLVISDLKMPDGSGIELLAHIRKSGSNIPFILMTGDINHEEGFNFSDTISRIFIKPLDVDELVEYAQELLKRV